VYVCVYACGKWGGRKGRVCMCVYMCVGVYVCVSVCVKWGGRKGRAYKCVYMCVGVYVCVYACMCVKENGRVGGGLSGRRVVPSFKKDCSPLL